MSILAAVMPAPMVPVELREYPEPDLAPGSALLRTIYSEVCGTDVHLWHGRLQGVPYPIIPGHVSVGRIEKLRGELHGLEGEPLREGDRVVFFDVHRTCGRCRACTIDRTPTRCPSRRVYGISDPAREGLFGGWSEAIYLEPGVSLTRLPDAVSAEDYIGGGCGLVTATHAVERADIGLGTSLVVQGTGAVGLSAIALARLSGAGTIVAIGAPADRLQLARDMGADLVLDVTDTSERERLGLVREATAGTGVDAIIEAAGSARAFEEGLNLVRDGGTYVIAGHYTNAGPSTVNVHEQINRKHVTIKGCWGSEVRHFLTAVRLLRRQAGRVPFRAIGARCYPLAGLNDALADAEAMRVPKALVAPNGMELPQS